MSDPPIQSGNSVIDGLFRLCVNVLLWLADLFGVSYTTINIWIFCVIWPALTISLMFLVYRQRQKIRGLERELGRE